MDPKIKSQWVAALRSGDYMQGQNYLKNNNTFCCLGVLCDLHSKETGTEWETEPIQGLHSTQSTYSRYLGAAGQLPYKVQDWCDFRHSVKTLVEMNDTQQLYFKEIADYIEEMV